MALSRLHGFEECHGESFAVCNRASLKSLTFAASDSSESSVKIAYAERNTVEKKPMVAVQSVNSWKALSLDVKLL